MNTLGIEAKLAQRYGYSPLPKDLSKKYREYFKNNIPSCLLGSTDKELQTSKGTTVSNGFVRIVVGDYGAFIEFNKEQANAKAYVVAPGQEYRINNPRYSNVKYHWYTIDDGSNVKIYYQKRKVSYADYKPGMYYVSVHEVILNSLKK